jgi:SAM-dependent methyltransferase
MVSLSLGCGMDPQCDIRIDVTRIDTRANVLADACTLPFRPNSFAYIFASNVLEHLKLHPYDALNELTYVCRIGGIIHIITPASEWRGLFLEILDTPLQFFRYLKRRKVKPAFGVVRHLFLIKKRRLGLAGTGFGGHRWYLPWGDKLYCTFNLLRQVNWQGFHVYYESYWLKAWCSPDGEEYRLRKMKRDQLYPPASDKVTIRWI